MAKRFWNKFKKTPQEWVLASSEEINLLNTLKELHRLNNYIGKEDEDYKKFIDDMNTFYKNILSVNKN